MAQKTAQDLQRIDQNREWYIAKSNELIQHSRYSLPLTHQKVLLYMISKVRPQDTGDEAYTFTIQEFCDVVGIDLNNTGGMYYAKIKDIVRQLGNAEGYIEYIDSDGKKHERPFTWLSHDKTDICEGSGTITIGFSKAIQSHLFDLKARYTQYKFIEVARLKSKYAIRLFELLRSYTTHEKLSSGQEVDQPFTVDELKRRMDAETYDRYFDFKKRVLVPAVEEINACSDTMHVFFAEHKRGKAVNSIIFTIGTPKAIEALKARSETRKRLNHMSY